ncbi:MAG: glycosyltransferase family 4 protein [Bacteroidales bacterium]|nr:MAG: glycosyltransferase family 4 protein [Bacteroidales bacterium]
MILYLSFLIIISRFLKDYKVFFILPVKYTNKIIRTLLRDDTNAGEVRKLKKYSYNNYEINILPFLSVQRFRNLHAILSYTLFMLNKKFINKLIVENNIDVVHAQFIFPDGLLAYNIWKKFGIPYVVTSHNELKYFKHSISRRLSLKIFKNAYRVTPINFTNYTTFQEHNVTNIDHIPLGFDEKLLELKKSEKHDQVKIITIASLIKLKNIDKVIMALARLDRDYNFQYNIVGDGPEKDNLEAIINQNKLEDKVKLLGRIAHDKIGDVLREHDIFIMPSFFETFGRVYFEAMALGLPVICAKNSGIYGFFKEMEEGISVDHTDIDDIRNKIELLISDKSLRTRIGNKGNELVKKYTWKSLAIRYNEMYKKSLEK